MAIAREIGARLDEGDYLRELGLTYRALDQLEQALAIFEEIESPYAEQARNDLAKLKGEK